MRWRMRWMGYGCRSPLLARTIRRETVPFGSDRCTSNEQLLNDFPKHESSPQTSRWIEQRAPASSGSNLASKHAEQQSYRYSSLLISRSFVYLLSRKICCREVHTVLGAWAASTPFQICEERESAPHGWHEKRQRLNARPWSCSTRQRGRSAGGRCRGACGGCRQCRLIAG